MKGLVRRGKAVHHHTVIGTMTDGEAGAEMPEDTAGAGVGAAGCPEMEAEGGDQGAGGEGTGPGGDGVVGEEKGVEGVGQVGGGDGQGGADGLEDLGDDAGVSQGGDVEGRGVLGPDGREGPLGAGPGMTLVGISRPALGVVGGGIDPQAPVRCPTEMVAVVVEQTLGGTGDGGRIADELRFRHRPR